MQHILEPPDPEPPDGASPPVPQVVYAERAEMFHREAGGLSARFDRFANLRAMAFVASAACLVWGVTQPAPVALGAGVVLGAAFVALVRYHGVLGLRRDRATAMAQINLEALARLERRWQDVPLRHVQEADRLHPYAADAGAFANPPDSSSGAAGHAVHVHGLPLCEELAGGLALLA
ncbi:MAG: hypothetical protein M3069_17695 [Chloroflexota bacterium]|nr:hypothetical protein [Chloroflexota bacterium]